MHQFDPAVDERTGRQTSFAAEWHPDQTTLGMDSHATAETPTCVVGNDWCLGISGMAMGELPCAECWFAAPGGIHVLFHEADEEHQGAR